ncbi:MAG: BPSS1780 family membrane protein [Pseudomonadota bacterium]
MEIRKVPATAGAEWLLEAFRLYRKSPFGFGTLGLIYAGLWLAMAVAAAAVPAIGVPLQLGFMIVGALLVAVMIFAAREVDVGRSASPGALVAAMQGGNGGRMMRALVPQAILALAMAGLGVVLIGQDNLVEAMETMQALQAKAQAGVQIDPQAVATEAIARVIFGGLIIMTISVLVFAFTITLLPDMLLDGRGLGESLKRSAAAGLRNLPAIIVYLVLGFVLLMAISIGFGIVLGVAQLIFGQSAAIVGNAVLYGLFVNVLAGTMYFAWKQMLGGEPDAAAPPAAGTSAGVAM